MLLHVTVVIFVLRYILLNMLSSPLHPAFLAAALLSAKSFAGLVPVHPSDLEVFPVLHERSSVKTIGDFSLVTSHENDTLLNLYAFLIVSSGFSHN